MNDDDTTALAGYGERGRMRACDADRDRVAELLNAAYSEGRLAKDEYDTRLENAFSARTYAELDQIVADLPAGAPAGAVTPAVFLIIGVAVSAGMQGTVH